jgi:superfamily I DNA/RNA helicase
MTFTPSAYQVAILEYIKTQGGHLSINAVAGSGKTTTLESIAELLQGNKVVSFAFNKHIADTLAIRLKQYGTEVKTINAFGHGICMRNLHGRVELNDRKYSKIVNDMLNKTAPFSQWAWSNNPAEKEKFDSAQKWLTTVANKIRLVLADFNDVRECLKVGHQFGVVYEGTHGDQLFGMVKRVIAEGLRQAKELKVIDFADQVFLPVHLGWAAPQFDYVLVDEAQDLNAAQRKLVFKAISKLGGRMIAVGDISQAIMGFAGADAHSFRLIQSELNAELLPLSVCYRCPKSHLALARSIVPHIEATENAIEGTINIIQASEVHSAVKFGDLILCRFTAPLVALCIALIKKRIPARVRGRDIGNELASLAEKIGKPVEWSLFLTALRAYQENKSNYLTQQEADDTQFQILADTVEALTVCYTDFGATNIDEMCSMIRDMFSDEKSSIYLSTIHRAKGLEADNVFILNGEEMPYTRGSADQIEQERNLLYVALTRAKSTLTFVSGDSYKACIMETTLQSWSK